MKAHEFHIPKLKIEALKLQVNKGPYFYDSYHYHPEIQLMLILNGTGTKIVGDHISSFGPGDISLIGPNLPHVYRSDERYYAPKSNLMSHALLVFFDPNIFGEFLNVPEMGEAKKLIEHSANGLEVNPNVKEIAAQKIRAIHAAKGLERIVGLLDVLQTISDPGKTTSLSGNAYQKPHRATDSQRLRDVFEHTMSNFASEIPLQRIAAIAHMSPTAFCRFFKQRTDKTYNQFLTELRISHACKLLVETDARIAEAAYQSGFNNLSHFNKKFLQVKRTTPSQFMSSVKQGA